MVRDWHERAQIRDEIETVGVTKGIQCAHTEFAHKILHRQHPARREDPRQQAPVQIVQRRIFEQQDSRRNLDAAEQNVRGGSASRPVGLPVRQCGATSS